MSQISIFNLGANERYKTRKPIRLIELFAGIGSQAKALRNLGANFEHYRICEFDKYAVQSYNEVHGTSFATSDITKIKAADLGITETDKYEYIMTYSFPCTDLSLAGNQQGMAKGSGTRSGLLWEVERLLGEITELPQILLMENVPQVLNKDFGGWLEYLESLGYKNYYKTLNAKDYGIPQNRKRVFMVSVLGNYYYEFPKEIPLKLRLKDMLESKVDEKYYISNTKIKKIITSNFAQEKAIIQTTDICGTILARDYKDPKCVPINSSEPKCEQVAQLTGTGYTEMTGRIYSDNGLCPTIRTMQGGNLEPKIAEPIIVDDIYKNREPREYGDTAPTLRVGGGRLKVVAPIICAMRGRNPDNPKSRKAGIPTVQKLEIGGYVSNTLTTVQKDNLVAEPQDKTAILPIVNYRVRKMTPKECWRLMGFSDTDFDKTTCSNAQLYKQAGNSIVVNVLMAIFKELL